MTAAETFPDSVMRSWNESKGIYTMYGITQIVATDQDDCRVLEYYRLVVHDDGALSIFHSGTAGYADCPKNWVLI